MTQLLRKWTEGLASSVTTRSALDLDPCLALMLNAAGVPTFRKALPQLSAEIQRARRHMRPLTVVLLSTEGRVQSEAADQWPLRGDSATRDDSPVRLTVPAAAWSVLLAPMLREALREMDLVSYVAAYGHCVVGMPETGAGEARQVVSRLAELCASRLLLQLRAGFGVFPQDGLTLEELVRHAQDEWERSGAADGERHEAECE